MAVPETAVNKHRCLILLQHNVGRPGELAIVHAIAQPFGEKIPPHNYLGTGVFSLHSRHAAMALLRSHHICHII